MKQTKTLEFATIGEAWRKGREAAAMRRARNPLSGFGISAAIGIVLGVLVAWRNGFLD